MAVRTCPACGNPNPPGSAFCSTCGTRFPREPPAPVIGRYSALRFQVDPTDPPPPRDARWVALVLGGCAVVIGVLLLLVDAIVSSAASSAGGGCGVGPGTLGCTTGPIEYLFLVPGVVLLGAGGALVAWVLARLGAPHSG